MSVVFGSRSSHVNLALRWFRGSGLRGRQGYAGAGAQWCPDMGGHVVTLACKSRIIQVLIGVPITQCAEMMVAAGGVPLLAPMTSYPNFKIRDLAQDATQALEEFATFH